MSTVMHGGAEANAAQEDARRAARWALGAQLLRRVSVVLLMVVPMGMYAAALADSSRAVGWVLLVLAAAAAWLAADAVQVRAGWHVLPGQRLPRRGDVALLAGVDVAGAGALIVGFAVVSQAVGQVPALSAVPGAFLLYELAWFCAAAVVGALVKVLARGAGARPGHAGRGGLARRTRVRVWVLAPVHLGIAVAALLVAQAWALPEVQADDLAFSMLAAAALLAALPLLRRGLAAVHR